jgi:two-component system cell cycle sensor histidine kinase/response regulator CckA
MGPHPSVVISGFPDRVDQRAAVSTMSSRQPSHRSGSRQIHAVLGTDVALDLALASDLAPVEVDRCEIEQVILNLAITARQAMPRGGRLTIETANIDADRDSAQDHDSVAVGPHVLLQVSDTGTGIDAETQARLFEPWFTTKSAAGGSGLGLATAQAIIAEAGGCIAVFSKIAFGTTFRIYLPQRSRAAEAPAR